MALFKQSPRFVGARLALALSTLILGLGQPLAAQTNTKIAVNGDKIGTSTFLTGFEEPVIDETGRVTFFGVRQRAGNAFGADAIFRWKPKSVSVLVEPGMNVPGGSLYVVGSHSVDGEGDHYFSINASGDVVFFGRQPESYNVNLYLKNAAGFRTIAKKDGLAPSGGTFSLLHTAAISDSGLVLFKAGLGNNGSQHCYYVYSGTTTTRQIAAGDLVPGGAIRDIAFSIGSVINSAGQIALWAGIDGDWGIYLKGTLGIEELMTGDGGGYKSLMINNAGQISFAGQNSGIHLTSNGTTSAIAHFDSPVVNGGALWFNNLNPALNEVGQVAFTGSDGSDEDGYDNGVYVWTNGEIRRIAAEGDMAPVLGSEPGGVFQWFGPPVINNLGEVAFLGTVNGEDSLYYWNGTLKKVIGAGDTLDGKIVSYVKLATMGATPAHRPINDAGRIAYKVIFTGNPAPEGVYLYTPVPVPPIITSATVGQAVVGRAFFYQIAAEHVPTSYLVEDLPPGLKYNATTGVISGTPKEGGNFVLKLKAINSSNKEVGNTAGTAVLNLTIANLSAHKGAYAGAVQGVTPSNANAGWASFTLTPAASATLALQWGGKKYSIKIAFDAEGKFTYEFPNTNVTLELALDTANSTDQITGTLKDNGVAMATLALDRKLTTYTTKNPVPRAGYFTVSLPPDPAHPEAGFPKGAGYAAVTISPAGAVRFAGVLADGQKVSVGVLLSKAWEFSLYVPLYKISGSYQGAFSGRVTVLTPTDPNPVAGTLHWFLPGAVAAKTVLASSLYVPPTKAAPAVLDFTPGDGVVAITGSDVSTTPGSKDVTVDVANKVKIVGTEKFSMTITAKTGLLSGTFYDTAGKARKFYGILLQDQNYGRGYFKGNTQFGHIAFDGAP